MKKAIFIALKFINGGKNWSRTNKGCFAVRIFNNLDNFILSRCFFEDRLLTKRESNPASQFWAVLFLFAVCIFIYIHIYIVYS
jgi:hypothetical protein